MALLRRGHAAGGGVRAHADPWRAQQRRWQLPVLAARPSALFRFKKLRRELMALRRTGDQDVHGFVEALEGWCEVHGRPLGDAVKEVHLASTNGWQPGVTGWTSGAPSPRSSPSPDQVVPAAQDTPDPALVFFWADRARS